MGEDITWTIGPKVQWTTCQVTNWQGDVTALPDWLDERNMIGSYTSENEEPTPGVVSCILTDDKQGRRRGAVKISTSVMYHKLPKEIPMGCDIHLYAEKKNRTGGKWRFATYLSHDRNYSLFAILAGVRNHYGFAGVDLGDPYNVIAPPRGLPADVSYSVRREFKSWGMDAHTPSWLTLEELLKFDWTQTVECRSRLSPDMYFKWEKTHFEGTPSEGLIECDSDACITMDEMKIIASEYHRIPEERNEDKAAFLEKHEGTVILVKWTETYCQSAGESWSDTMAVLKATAEGTKNLSDVRIVFWFDN